MSHKFSVGDRVKILSAGDFFGDTGTVSGVLTPYEARKDEYFIPPQYQGKTLFYVFPSKPHPRPILFSEEEIEHLSDPNEKFVRELDKERR